MLTAVLWGASFVGTRLVIDAVPPLTLGFARAVLGVLLLVAVAWLSGHRLTVPWAAWRWLALLGLLGVAYFYVAINLALQWTTATRASLLTLPYPVMTALGARLFLNESIGPRRATGIAIALAGALTLTLATAQDSVGGAWLGNLLAFSTTVAWTAYTLVGREVLPAHPPLVATAHLLLAGSVALLPLAALELTSGQVLQVTVESVAVTAFLGLACTCIAYLTWNRGLSLLGATRASVYLYVQPLAVILLAVPILGERLTIVTVAGGLVIVLGTWLVVRPEQAPGAGERGRTGRPGTQV
jgi:drug/metabolite transporter (DMT)-like permease